MKRARYTDRAVAVLALFVTLALLGAMGPPVLAAPGDLDSSFDGDGKVLTVFVDDGQCLGVATQPDGRIVVVGFASVGATADFALARYNRDGSLDASFGTGGKVITGFGGVSERGHGVAIQPDGRIVAAGTAFVDGNFKFAVARYLAR